MERTNFPAFLSRNQEIGNHFSTGVILSGFKSVLWLPLPLHRDRCAVLGLSDRSGDELSQPEAGGVSAKQGFVIALEAEHGEAALGVATRADGGDGVELVTTSGRAGFTG